MCVIQTSWQRKGEVRAHEDEFGVTSIHRVSGENRFIAQILHFMTAIPAITVHTSHPGNPHSRSDRQLRGRTFDYLSNDLMSGNERRLNRRQILFHDVQISPANSAGKNAKQNAPSLKLRTRNILGFEELSSCRARGCENGGFQSSAVLSISVSHGKNFFELSRLNSSIHTA